MPLVGKGMRCSETKILKWDGYLSTLVSAGLQFSQYLEGAFFHEREGVGLSGLELLREGTTPASHVTLTIQTKTIYDRNSQLHHLRLDSSERPFIDEARRYLLALIKLPKRDMS